MFINELPEVAGVIQGLLKFIVLEVTQGGKKRLLVRAAEFKRIPEQDRSLSHNDIFYSLSEELGGAEVKMTGGGWLDVSKDCIEIHGNSHQHGEEPDRENTASMLQRAFPKHKIERG